MGLTFYTFLIHLLKGVESPIHGKDSILVSPLGRCNDVYGHDDPKNNQFSVRCFIRVGHIPNII